MNIIKSSQSYRVPFLYVYHNKIKTKNYTAAHVNIPPMSQFRRQYLLRKFIIIRDDRRTCNPAFITLRTLLMWKFSRKTLQWHLIVYQLYDNAVGPYPGVLFPLFRFYCWFYSTQLFRDLKFRATIYSWAD